MIAEREIIFLSEIVLKDVYIASRTVNLKKNIIKRPRKYAFHINLPSSALFDETTILNDVIGDRKVYGTNISDWTRDKDESEDENYLFITRRSRSSSVEDEVKYLKELNELIHIKKHL